MFEWEKTQILIAHQKESIGWTKKVPLAAKKSSAKVCVSLNQSILKLPLFISVLSDKKFW